MGNRIVSDNLQVFYVEVKSGNIPGYSTINQFGHSNAIVNNVWSLISSVGISSAMLSSPTPARIKAGGNVGDINDGSGAREIAIVGLDSNLVEITETIVTSGSNASQPTTASFWRIYRSYVTKVGVYGNANLGDVVIEDSSGVSDILSITDDEGQTQHGAYAVPYGKTGYLSSIHLTSDGSKPADFRMFIRQNLTNIVASISPKRSTRFFGGVLGDLTYSPVGPHLVLPALTDIWFEAKGAGGNTEVAVEFEILLIDDDHGHIKRI